MPKVDESSESVPAWLLWPVRAIAVVVVLPFRLLFEAVKAIGRYVLAPLWRYLVEIPLGWLWRTLLEPVLKALVDVVAWILKAFTVPLRWLWRHVIVPAGELFLRWVLRPLGRAIAATGEFLWRWLLGPVCRAAGWFLNLGWQGTSWLFRQFYRFLLRPLGLAIAFVWRYTFGPVLRALAWAGRWVRDEILRPAGAAVRSVLAAFGLVSR